MSRNILVGVVVVVALIAGGGWWYFNQSSVPAESIQFPTLQENTNTGTQAATNPAAVQNSETANWKTYKNTQHGYEIRYPSTATVTLVGSGSHPSEEKLSLSDDWYASTCVALNDGSKSWYINVSTEAGFSQSACGPTGVADSRRENETVAVDGRQVVTNGHVNMYRPSAFFSLELSDRVHVVYGVEAQTQQEYSQTLNAIHEILSTLKLVPGFIPSSPPPNGRG